MTPMKCVLKAAESLKTNNVSVIKNAGHMLPSEHPEEVNRAYVHFLLRVKICQNSNKLQL